MEKLIFVYKLPNLGIEIDSRESHLEYCIAENNRHKNCYLKEIDFLRGTAESNEEFALVTCYVK
jgi:hypothetical protein